MIWKKFENEAEKARERLLGQMKELHSVFKDKFPQMEFIQELQNLEVQMGLTKQIYALASSRIRHLKHRFHIYDFFERVRVAIAKNHNSIVNSLTSDIESSVQQAKTLGSEMGSHFEKMHEYLSEVASMTDSQLETTSFDHHSGKRNLLHYFDRTSLVEFSQKSRKNYGRSSPANPQKECNRRSNRSLQTSGISEPLWSSRRSSCDRSLIAH